MQAQRGQAALERKVAVLEAHQLEVHNVLCSLEDEAQRLYRVPFPVMLPAVGWPPCLHGHHASMAAEQISLLQPQHLLYLRSNAIFSSCHGGCCGPPGPALLQLLGADMQPESRHSWVSSSCCSHNTCSSLLQDMTTAGPVQEELPNADQDAKARDAMYERAEGLGTTLSRMGEQLRTAIHSVNDAAYASQVKPAVFCAHSLAAAVCVCSLSISGWML